MPFNYPFSFIKIYWFIFISNCLKVSGDYILQQSSVSIIEERSQAVNSVEQSKEKSPANLLKRQKTSNECDAKTVEHKDQQAKETENILSRESEYTVDDNKDAPVRKKDGAHSEKEYPAQEEVKTEVQMDSENMNGVMVTNMKHVTKSRLLGDRDTSLPPKADKYRIRSSIADGEAALPPSKRRQRALEAMSACAAEAAEVVECQQTGKNIIIKDDKIIMAAEISSMPKTHDLDSAVQPILSGHQKVNASQSGEEIVKRGNHLSSDNHLKSKSNAGVGVLDHKKDSDLPLHSPKAFESGKPKQPKSSNQNKASEGLRASTEKLDVKPKFKAAKNIHGTEKLIGKLPHNSEKHQDQHIKHGKQHEHHQEQPGKHGKHQDTASKHSDATSKPQEHHGKLAGMNNSKVSGMPKVPLDVKPGLKQTIKGANAMMSGRFEILGAPKLQIESNPNKVREA